MSGGGDLDLLGRQHQSDKSSLAHGYLATYAEWFGEWRDAPITLIEFCDRGSTAPALWRDWFSAARILAIFPQLREERSWYGDNPRLHLREGRQDDPALLRDLALGVRPHIIIDDGEHRWDAQIDALAGLFRSLAPGGLYVIEDTQTLVPPLAGQYAGGAGWSVAGLIDAIAGGGAPPMIAESYERDAIAAVLAPMVAEILRAPGLLALRRNAADPPGLVEVAPAQALATRFRAVDAGGSYPRLPATLVDCPGWLVERFESVSGSGVERDVPPGGIAWFAGATIHGRGLITAADGRIVAESLINAEHARTVGGFVRLAGGALYAPDGRNLPVDRLADGPHVLLKQMWDDNYGHWLIESLPRALVLAALEAMPSTTRWIVQTEAGPISAVYRDTLAWIGIGPGNVLPTHFASALVPDLIYPLPLTRQPWVKAPIVLRALEALGQRVTAGSGPSPRRVYLARGAGHRRRLLNEEAIIALVRARGFEVVLPDAMSFADQVRAFAGADLVVGVLGAGLSSLVFSPPGVRCIGLASEYLGDDFFYDIICHKGGSYVSLHGKASDPALGMNADFTLDPALLERYLPD